MQMEAGDFLPAPEGAGLPDSSNTVGFIHRLEFDTVRAYLRCCSPRLTLRGTGYGQLTCIPTLRVRRLRLEIEVVDYDIYAIAATAVSVSSHPLKEMGLLSPCTPTL